MEKEYYTSGQVARKLGVSRRTVSHRASKGLISGQIPHEKGVHRRYRRSVIDQMVEGGGPPVRAALMGAALEIELRGLAKEPLRVSPCPGEFPEIDAPELSLPGGVTLPAWHLDRIPSPLEVIQSVQQHLWW